MRNAHQVLVTEEMLEKVKMSRGIISKNIDDDGRSRGAGTRARTELVSHRESCLVHCKQTSWGGACLTLGKCAAFREVSA
jgi:hypothetical protein